ncbi:MAG: TetR family transcriptional regulator [Candidatus Dormibacteraeota bacterium]|nr:TetR family transcriptional regulator [Candidatus Dormibacteraeota bacterium]
MATVPERENEPAGLSREAVIAAALHLLDDAGLDGFSMRALGDRLGVRAASLYWHFRDKEQLLDGVVASVLDGITLPKTSGWRAQASGGLSNLRAVLDRHTAAMPIILARPQVVSRSNLAEALAQLLTGAGVEGANAAALTLVVEAVTAAALSASAPVVLASDRVLTLSIESGSSKVAVRAGSTKVVGAAASSGGTAPPQFRPDGTVAVSSRRSGRHGAVELNPAYPWFVKVHSGVWKADLDMSGLLITGVDIDSGTGNITCTLPAPRGVVPVTVNSGLMNVTLHRPVEAAVHAVVHAGSFRVKFDKQPVRMLSSDVDWDTPGAASASDRYDVTVHSGSMNVTMDASAPSVPIPDASVATRGSQQHSSTSGVDLVLDGIEHRLSG